jgi:hypothetical protein
MAVEPCGAHAAGFDIALVVSRADASGGEGVLVASPVKQAALDLGLPVTDQIDDVLDVGADLGSSWPTGASSGRTCSMRWPW